MYFNSDIFYVPRKIELSRKEQSKMSMLFNLILERIIRDRNVKTIELNVDKSSTQKILEGHKYRKCDIYQYFYIING